MLTDLCNIENVLNLKDLYCFEFECKLNILLNVVFLSLKKKKHVYICILEVGLIITYHAYVKVSFDRMLR